MEELVNGNWYKRSLEQISTDYLASIFFSDPNDLHQKFIDYVLTYVIKQSFLFFISDGDESIRSPILESTLDSSRNSNNEDQGNLLKGIV